MSTPSTQACQFCGQTFPVADMIPAATVRAPVAAEIRQELPGWKPSGYICQADLDRFRFAYVQSILQSEEGEVSAIDADVLQSLQQHEMVSQDVDTQFDEALTTGQWLSDRLAAFGGSWAFIGAFAAVMAIWIVANTLGGGEHFDPFPYILLNLVLSCLAALQAPVIMMSQNRQETKDRIRSQHDYKVNLKAELEIRHLHEKVDHLLRHQWERLVEIQQIQLDLLDELRRRAGREQ